MIVGEITDHQFELGELVEWTGEYSRDGGCSTRHGGIAQPCYRFKNDSTYWSDWWVSEKEVVEIGKI